jgi:hypothetical protein
MIVSQKWMRPSPSRSNRPVTFGHQRYNAANIPSTLPPNRV